MGSPATVPMFAPNGQTGDIPANQVEAARAAGFKVAVTMQSPDGKNGYIPADRVHDAAGAGFKMVPLSVPDTVKASYWDALTNPVGSGGAEQGIIGGAQQIGGQAIKTGVQPVAHPIQTAEGVYNIVRHPINTAKAIGQNFENDVSQGGYPLAVENAVGQLIGSFESGRLLAAGAEPAAQAATQGAAKLAPRLYESALKPSTTLSQADRANIVQTGIENNIPISADGLDKLNNRIADLNQAVKDQIASDPTRSISPGPAVQRLQGVRARFANQVNPGSDLDAIDNVQQEFLNQLRSTPGGAVRNLTAEEAQAMKQGTYRALGNKSYGELKGATVEAQKALARGLKDEIANQFPEINQLNAAESRLLDLQPVLEKAVNRISNHQLFGIGTPLVGGATAAVTGSGPLGAAAAFLKAAIDNPVVKSRLAIALSKGAKIPYGEAASRVGAYSAALGSSVAAPQASQGGQAPTQ